MTSFQDDGKGGVGFKGGSLHDGFGGFDGFGGSGDQKYPQYCWEFHDRLWEALSGTTSEKKKKRPQPYWGERILEMLSKPQMP